MSQLSVENNTVEGTIGLLADLSPNNDAVTMNNPANVIQFGQAVEKIFGDEDGIKPPDNDNPDIRGVAVQDSREELGVWPLNSAVTVLKRGRIYVAIEGVVTADDNVFVRNTGRAQVQTFTLDSDLDTGNVITVTVDGVVLSETFATSHDATMALFAAQIEAQGSVLTAVAVAQVITITSTIQESTASTVLTDELITGGPGQANIVIAETTPGIANIDRGKFRADADGGTANRIFDAHFERVNASGTLAVLDINIGGIEREDV